MPETARPKTPEVNLAKPEPIVVTLREPPVIWMPPAKVEVAVVEVALKYGAPILVPDSMPPENVEVAVVVAVKEPMTKFPFWIQ